MIRCADAAGQRADPLAGTAPPAHRWLLLEHPGRWPVDAVAGSGIDAAVLGEVTDAALGNRTRILLVRRPGRRTPSVERRWLLLSTGGATVSGRWTDDTDLLVAAAELGKPPQTRASGPTPEPVVLVCAHGVHDTCCALRGRPVAAALAERWPEAVWECSHVGGDRFAPNVVLLPDGYYYGGLDPVSAVDVVADHLAGRVRADALRGMARYPRPSRPRWWPPSHATVHCRQMRSAWPRPGTRAATAPLTRAPSSSWPCVASTGPYGLRSSLDVDRPHSSPVVQHGTLRPPSGGSNGGSEAPCGSAHRPTRGRTSRMGRSTSPPADPSTTGNGVRSPDCPLVPSSSTRARLRERRPRAQSKTPVCPHEDMS